MTIVHLFIGIVHQPGIRQAAAVCTDLLHDTEIFLFPATTPAIGTSLVNNRSHDGHSTSQNSCFLICYIGELTERVP